MRDRARPRALWVWSKRLRTCHSKVRSAATVLEIFNLIFFCHQFVVFWKEDSMVAVHIMSESNSKNNPQFNFKSQNIIWNDGKVTIIRIWHLLFLRLWKNIFNARYSLTSWLCEHFCGPPQTSIRFYLGVHNFA